MTYVLMYMHNIVSLDEKCSRRKLKKIETHVQ